MDNKNNIPAIYRNLIGVKFSALEFEEQAAARKATREGYLRIEPGTRIVRPVQTLSR